MCAVAREQKKRGIQEIQVICLGKSIHVRISTQNFLLRVRYCILLPVRLVKHSSCDNDCSTQLWKKHGSHHSLTDFTGCLLHLGQHPGCLFEDGMLYNITKDGSQGYVSKCWHPWRPAQEA